MITRIVKLSFKEDKTEEFLDIFNTTKNRIRSSKGCISLELLKAKNKNNEFYTYSFWESEEFLEKYRSSDFFIETWKKTKVLFNKKAEAQTLVSLEKLD